MPDIKELVHQLRLSWWNHIPGRIQEKVTVLTGRPDDGLLEVHIDGVDFSERFEKLSVTKGVSNEKATAELTTKDGSALKPDRLSFLHLQQAKQIAELQKQNNEIASAIRTYVRPFVGEGFTLEGMLERMADQVRIADEIIKRHEPRVLDRLQTIADELDGPHPVLGLDKLLDIVEDTSQRYRMQAANLTTIIESVERWIDVNSNNPTRGFINFADLRERLKPRPQEVQGYAARGPLVLHLTIIDAEKILRVFYSGEHDVPLAIMNQLTAMVERRTIDTGIYHDEGHTHVPGSDEEIIKAVKRGSQAISDDADRMFEESQVKTLVWRDAPQHIEETGTYRVEWDAEGCPETWYFRRGDALKDMGAPDWPEILPAYPTRIAGPINIQEPAEPKEATDENS